LRNPLAANRVSVMSSPAFEGLEPDAPERRNQHGEVKLEGVFLAGKSLKVETPFLHPLHV